MSLSVVEGKAEVGTIPERRPPREERLKARAEAQARGAGGLAALPLPVWRCVVCGYLCARAGPPEICPVCKAKRDRFERFI